MDKIKLNDEQIKKIEITCRKASDAILNIYHSDFKIDYKEDDSPLTKADILSNEIIIKFLENEFPNFAILSEEKADDKSRLNNPYCWLVDPLDGTKEFINKRDTFTINIALSFENKVIFGMIYAPVYDKLYYGGADYNSFLIENNAKKQIKVSNRVDKLRIVASKSHMAEEMKYLIDKNKDKIGSTISMGSSLKGCLIAEGEAEIYYRHNPTWEWDTAAMQAIIEGAGGLLLEMGDTLMLYNRENPLNSKGFYALNKKENSLVV